MLIDFVFMFLLANPLGVYPVIKDEPQPPVTTGCIDAAPCSAH